MLFSLLFATSLEPICKCSRIGKWASLITGWGKMLSKAICPEIVPSCIAMNFLMDGDKWSRCCGFQSRIERLPKMNCFGRARPRWICSRCSILMCSICIGKEFPRFLIKVSVS